MEDAHSSRECMLKRCYQVSRFEEELWAKAYEELWPLIRRSLARAADQDSRAASADRSTRLAKGA